MKPVKHFCWVLSSYLQGPCHTYLALDGDKGTKLSQEMVLLLFAGIGFFFVPLPEAKTVSTYENALANAGCSSPIRGHAAGAECRHWDGDAADPPSCAWCGGVTDGIRVTSTGADAPTINFYAGTATPDAGHISFGDNTGWRFHITRASDGTNLVTVQDNGDVGIGTVTPTQRLHVVGNVQFSGALMPGGNAGTTGQVLVSQGAGNAPQWQAPSALTGFYKLLFVDAWNPSVTSNLDWSCSGCDGAPPYLTTCGSVRMLGGYGMCGNGCYFEKTFTGLPAHTEVMVEVFWWSLDSWDQNSGTGVDLVALHIDDTEVSRATPYGPNSLMSVRSSDASVCGTGWVDAGPQILVGWTAHTASSVTVRVINLADQGSTDESMGIVMVCVWVK
jgi:hypothetical protein